MDGDYKIGLVFVFMGLLLLGSYYATYRIGAHLEYKKIETYLPKAFEKTYWEGYDDGLKQGQLDCVIKGVINAKP